MLGLKQLVIRSCYFSVFNSMTLIFFFFYKIDRNIIFEVVLTTISPLQFQILSTADMEAEFSWRRQLFYSTCLVKVTDVLLNEKHQGLSQLYRSAVVDGYQTDILGTLDEIARDCNSPGKNWRSQQKQISV